MALLLHEWKIWCGNAHQDMIDFLAPGMDFRYRASASLSFTKLDFPFLAAGLSFVALITSLLSKNRNASQGMKAASSYLSTFLLTTHVGVALWAIQATLRVASARKLLPYCNAFKAGLPDMAEAVWLLYIAKVRIQCVLGMQLPVQPCNDPCSSVCPELPASCLA